MNHNEDENHRFIRILFFKCKRMLLTRILYTCNNGQTQKDKPKTKTYSRHKLLPWEVKKHNLMLLIIFYEKSDKPNICIITLFCRKLPRNTIHLCKVESGTALTLSAKLLNTIYLLKFHCNFVIF